MDESSFDDLSRRMALAANRRTLLKGALGIATAIAGASVHRSARAGKKSTSAISPVAENR